MKKLHSPEQYVLVNGGKSLYIPERFIEAVDAHMLGNMLDISNYPLILLIVGLPGMGKTYQLRSYLEIVGVEVFSISAADLESDRAGVPAKLLEQKYIEASSSISSGNPAVLLIDDIDTTLGEWKKNTGTVNHQDILAFLMHIADKPSFIENVGSVNRVPVFFTCNYFNRLYKPLIRDGRANRFDWEPTREEKIAIVTSVFRFEDSKTAEMLVDAYPTKPISFFSNLLANKNIEQLVSVAKDVVFSFILTKEGYRDKLLSTYSNLKKNIQWEAIAKEALAENTVLEDVDTIPLGNGGESY
jgi:SpoVK/Ycf46/Vps4 family AAA+-type ATPase